ncbi:MAG: YfgM family protein [Planctomycetota bacterium]|jgi:tetratricopeptide (TPR) repeat protein
MKAEHRHELKTNELADWLGNLPQWSKDNIVSIIAVAIAIVLSAGAYYFFGSRRQSISLAEQQRFTQLVTQMLQSKREVMITHERDKGDISFMLLTLAKDLVSFSNTARDPQRSAFALVQAGEAVRSELHYRSTPISAGEKKQQIDLAKGHYNNALLKGLGSSSLEAMARFGLGLCEEEMGNFTEAERIYTEIISNSDYEYAPALLKAKDRISALEQYQEPVIFERSADTGRQIGASLPSRLGPAGPRVPSRVGPRVPQVQVDVPGIKIPSVPKDTVPPVEPAKDSTGTPPGETDGSDSNEPGQ